MNHCHSVVAIYKSHAEAEVAVKELQDAGCDMKTFMKLTMKKQLWIVPVLTLAAFAAGCDKQPTTEQQLNKVKVETKQAAEDMKEYTYAEKAEFVKQMQVQLDQLNQDLNQLSAKVENSTDAVKAEAKPKLQALRDEATQLTEQLTATKGATETTWDSVKAGSKKAYAAVKDGVIQTRQWLSDKIAP